MFLKFFGVILTRKMPGWLAGEDKHSFCPAGLRATPKRLKNTNLTSGTIVADGICSTSREKLKVGKGHMRMKQKEGI